MTNPFKVIAPALGVRGLLFSLLGLVLLARAVPTLLSMQGMPDIGAAAIGVFLLTFGVVDLVRAAQKMTRLRKEKLEVAPIDLVYSAGGGGERLPRTLMAADDNPNEANQAVMIDWLARVFPRTAFLPGPYTGILHGVLIGLLLGVLGVVAMIVLRVLLAGSTTPPQLALILDWSMWFYFVLGFGFWAAISRFGFRRALHFEKHLGAVRMVGAFVVLLGGAIALTIASTLAGNMPPPPGLGVLPTILVAGSAGVILGTAVIILVRSRRAPSEYSVHRDEEFVTVGMHPTDIINVVKSYTGKLAGGQYWHLGSWKPQFAEHTAVSAGEFEADLNAESSIALNDGMGVRPEQRLGAALAWLGVLLIAAAGYFLFQAASTDWSSATRSVNALALPAGLTVFGFLFYRVGLVPVAELEWTSVITSCDISGTFQTQGGMAFMNSGDHSLKGSVLTSATIQPRCAYLTSVGYLLPGASRQKVARLIDRVEPAGPIAKELIAAVHNQARQMMSAGTQQMPPAGPALTDQSEEAEAEDPGTRPSTH